MRKTTVVHISREYQKLLKKISDKTKLPIRYITEAALYKYLEKEYPDFFKLLKEIEDEKES
jgi:hypothetical protein